MSVFWDCKVFALLEQGVDRSALLSLAGSIEVAPLLPVFGDTVSKPPPFLSRS